MVHFKSDDGEIHVAEHRLPNWCYYSFEAGLVSKRL